MRVLLLLLLLFGFAAFDFAAREYAYRAGTDDGLEAQASLHLASLSQKPQQARVRSGVNETKDDPSQMRTAVKPSDVGLALV